MVELKKMNSESGVLSSPEGSRSSGFQSPNDSEAMEEISHGEVENQPVAPSHIMNHSYDELRQSGEWTVISCKYCNSLASSSEFSSNDKNKENLVCTCKNIHTIPTDSASTDSSSDVAVINESDIDESDHLQPVMDLDGIPRLRDFSIFSDKSYTGSISSAKSSTDEAHNHSATLRLRLKKLPKQEKVARRDLNKCYKPVLVTPRKSAFLETLREFHKKMANSDDGFLSSNRTITFLMSLIIIFCILALLCLVFAFLMKHQDSSQPKASLLFKEVEELEKEFLECLNSKQEGLNCNRNLMFWKNSLSELLTDEKERIKILIDKLDQIGHDSEPLKEKLTVMKEEIENVQTYQQASVNELSGNSYPNINPVQDDGFNPEYNQYSESVKIDYPADSENSDYENSDYVEIDSDDPGEEEEEEDDDEGDISQGETIESLRKQKEALEKLYILEKTESDKWKNLFEEHLKEKSSEREEEEKIPDPDESSHSFFPDSMWKEIKRTAENLNPHLQKFQNKLSKVIEDNIVGARELGSSLHKRWVKNSKKFSKKIQKLRKAWNEDEHCDETCVKNSENTESLDNLNNEAEWYTKRLRNLYFSDNEDDNDNEEASWVFKRAKSRAEKQKT